MTMPLNTPRLCGSVALAGGLALGACQPGGSPPKGPASTPPSAQGSGAIGTPPGSPIGAPAAADLPVLATVPDFLFVDQRAEPYGSPDLRGKVFIADFFYTSCTAICERLTAKVTEVQKNLANDPLFADVKIVSFSVDPEHDTPAVLKNYGERFKADRARWHFLTGTRTALWHLSQDGFKLGVGDAPANDAQGPVFHSDRLALVDRDGHLRGLYDAFAPDTQAALLRDLAVLLKAPPAQPIVVPPEAENPAWLEPRKQAQIAAAGSIGAFHDFKFVDRVAESGITYRHAIVDDSGKDDKAVHYDHGTALAVADVDADGRPDLFFVNQLGRSELWRNLGPGEPGGPVRFEDMTAASGITVPNRVAVGASFADIDNDGDADLLITSVREGNLLFLNDGKGHFQDVSATSGLASTAHGAGAVFFDYDRDGLLDVFICNVGMYSSYVKGRGGYYIGFVDAFGGHLKPERAEASRLYHNEGRAVFRDVSAAEGLDAKGWSGDAGFFDQNDDGFPDLYVLNMQGADLFFRNKAGKGFENTGRKVFPKTSWGTMGLQIFDFDGDGRLDLFTTDMHGDMSVPAVAPEHEKDKIAPDQMYPPDFLATDAPLVYGNAAWRNTGGHAKAAFEEVSDAIGFETFWPWGLSVGDLNADGDPDVFITAGMGYPFRYGINSVLLNDGGKHFADAEFILGVEPRRDGRTTVPFFDLDCGPTGADRDHKLCAKGSPGHNVVWAARSSRSSAMVDLDGDGDLDVVTQEFNDRPQILLSDLSARHPVHAVQIALTGTKSNRSGLGAVVAVTAGGKRRIQLNDGKSGYLGQSVLPLYFGLGDATTVDRVEVQWPSGRKQILKSPVITAGRIQIAEE